MKTFTFTYLPAFFLFCSFTYAQPKHPHPVTSVPPDQSWIKKGYYSFGNHESRLQLPPAILVSVPAKHRFENTGKGYHSISSGQPAQLSNKRVRLRTAPPVINKGYYSIGSNADKLAR